MNKDNFDRLIVDSGVPLDPSKVATPENLSFAIRENEVRAKRDEQDPYAMTADKLAKKIPGMAAGVPFIGVVASDVETRKEFMVEAYSYREEDEELLRAEQEAYRAEHPEPDPGRSGDPADGEGA